MDRTGRFYFVSTRSYGETLSTIYQGRFWNCVVSDVEVVAGISEKKPGRVNFDVEVSAGGDTLYFVDGIFKDKPVPEAADLVIAVRNGSGFRRLNENTVILKKVNTAGALEYAACISSDELECFLPDTILPVPRSTALPDKPRTAPLNCPNASPLLRALWKLRHSRLTVFRFIITSVSVRVLRSTG